MTKSREERKINGEVINRLNEMSEERKNDLINQYSLKPDDTFVEKGARRLAICVGNWHYRIADVIEKGGTEEEINALLNHMFVVMNSDKYHLDIIRSAKDIRKIIRKYGHKI